MFKRARCFLLLILWSRLAFGQAAPDTSVALPDVTVTATRILTPTGRAPVRVGVLDNEAIQATASSSAADLLEARSSLFVKRYGASGLSSISLRGSSPAQTLVLLDGHRIADPQLGELDLSLLPTILMQSVEVVHGASSSLYGTDGMGGVVNIRTVAPTDAPQVRVRGGAGAYGARTGSLLFSQRTGRLSGLALVDYDGTDGDFPYLDRGFLPPRETRRTGADRNRRSFLSSIGYTGLRNELQAAIWYSDAERGLPGIATVPGQGERQWDESLRFWADGRTRKSWGSVRAGGLVQRGAIRYVNPALGVDDTGRTLISSLEVEATTLAGERWLVAGGLSGGYGTARHPSLASDASELHSAAFLHGVGRFGRLLVYPALRGDTYFVHAAGTRVAFSPQLGINVQPFASRELYVKASAGHAFRAPTFNERYWQPGGNPNLQPEHGWTLDTGLFLQMRRGYAELTGFSGFTRDQIVWQPGAAGYYAPVNVLTVRRRGLELGYHVDSIPFAGTRIHGGAIYSFVEAVDWSERGSPTYGRQLRYVPREQAKAYVGIRLGPAVFDLNGRYTGRRYVTADESQYLDPFFVLDAQVRMRHAFAGLRAELSLVLENVTDAHYAVLQNYPMPPRHALLRLLIETTPSEQKH